MNSTLTHAAACECTHCVTRGERHRPACTCADLGINEQYRQRVGLHHGEGCPLRPRRRGRPSGQVLLDESKRSVNRVICVDAVRWATWQAAATSAGVTMSEWVRGIVDNAMEK